MKENSDIANELLLQQSKKEIKGKKLFFFSDNHAIVENLDKSFFGEIITRRIDVNNKLSAKGFNSRCDSFIELKFEPQTYDCILYRVGKEKALVHHVINKAFQMLKEGGRLYLSGYRTEGIKTYVEKAQQLFACKAQQKTHLSGARSASLVKSVLSSEKMLDERRCSETRSISAKGFEFISRPGIFGWDKVDPGSRFLVQHLPNLDGQSVLDLGCGYGYLSIMAHKKGAKKVQATDNLVDAVHLCRQNFEKFLIEGQVTLSNCADTITESFDTVLCNPPFHSAFEVDSELTRSFAQSCFTHLNEAGQAFVVVNAFIPFEKIALNYFAHCEEIANNKSFKVLKLKR